MFRAVMNMDSECSGAYKRKMESFILTQRTGWLLTFIVEVIWIRIYKRSIIAWHRAVFFMDDTEMAKPIMGWDYFEKLWLKIWWRH